MRRIKKTFTVTTIIAAALTVANGKVESTTLEPVETMETVTDNNAIKLFKKLSTAENVKGLNLVLISKDTHTVTYAMSAADFIKNGYVVTDDSDNGDE